MPSLGSPTADLPLVVLRFVDATVRMGIFRMPALLEEDGAKFCARIVAVGADGFRASCWAELVNGDVEMPDHHVAASDAAARQWVHEVAARRGFTKIGWRP